MLSTCLENGKFEKWGSYCSVLSPTAPTVTLVLTVDLFIFLNFLFFIEV